MPSVFLVNDEGTAVLKKEAVSLCQYLSKVSSNELLYIIMAYDYCYGPYHRLPLHERRSIALRRTYKNRKNAEEIDKKLSKAIEEYNGLIFDIKRTQRDVYLQKQHVLNNRLIEEDNPTRIKEILSSLSIIENKVSDIDRAIESEEEVIKLTGGKRASLIEILISNRKNYKATHVKVGYDGEENEEK